MRPWNGSMISTISLTMLVGVKNSPPFCPSAHGELAEEVFVDLAEGIPSMSIGIDGEVLQQRDQQVLFQRVVGLGQNVLEVFVLGLDGLHGVVDGLADVGALRQIQQGGEPRLSPGGRGRPAPGSRSCRSSGVRCLAPPASSPPPRTCGRHSAGRSAPAPGRNTPTTSAWSWPAVRRRRPRDVFRDQCDLLAWSDSDGESQL